MNNLSNDYTNNNGNGNVQNNYGNNRNPKNLNWFCKKINKKIIQTTSGSPHNTDVQEGKFTNFVEKINRFIDELGQIKPECWDEGTLNTKQMQMKTLYKNFRRVEKKDTKQEKYCLVRFTSEKGVNEVSLKVDVYEKIQKACKLVMVDLPGILSEKKRTANIQQEVEKIQHILKENGIHIPDEIIQDFLKAKVSAHKILATFGLDNSTESNRDLTLSDKTGELVNYFADKEKSRKATSPQNKPGEILFKNNRLDFERTKGCLEKEEVNSWNECIESFANPDKKSNKNILVKMQAHLSKVEKKLDTYRNKIHTKTKEKLEKIQNLNEIAIKMRKGIMYVQYVQGNNITLKEHLCFNLCFKHDFTLKTCEMEILPKFLLRMDGSVYYHVSEKWNEYINYFTMNVNYIKNAEVYINKMQKLSNYLKLGRSKRFETEIEKKLLNSIQNKMDEALRKVRDKIKKLTNNGPSSTTTTSSASYYQQFSIVEFHEICKKHGFNIDVGELRSLLNAINADDILSNIVGFNNQFALQQQWDNRNKQSSQLETKNDKEKFLSDGFFQPIQPVGILKEVVDDWNDCIASFAKQNEPDFKKNLKHMKKLHEKVSDQFDRYSNTLRKTKEYEEGEEKLTEIDKIATIMSESIKKVQDACTVYRIKM